MIDILIGVAAYSHVFLIDSIRLDMCSTLITDFIISILTIKSTPCWSLSLRPLYYITLPLSVTFSLVLFHLTSDIPIGHFTYTSLVTALVLLSFHMVIGFEHNMFLLYNVMC